jgi:Asp/Glu/hydantoin racemase
LPPGSVAGVLTISGSSLTSEHLTAANVPPETPIGTTEGGRVFTRAILDNEAEMDVVVAEEDNVAAACALQAKTPSLGAIVLECTNMCPYAHAIRHATGLPVFDMVTFVNWFHAGLTPKCFR